MAALRNRPEATALRSYAKLVEACRTLSNEGGWRQPEEIGASLARSVVRMFMGLASVDKRFDEAERELLAVLCQLDSTYEGHLERTLRAIPEPSREWSLLDIVRAAIEFDRREGTDLAPEIVEAFESLAYAIIGSDGTIAIEELESLGEWVASLYAALGEAIPAGSDRLAIVGA